MNTRPKRGVKLLYGPYEGGVGLYIPRTRKGRAYKVAAIGGAKRGRIRGGGVKLQVEAGLYAIGAWAIKTILIE